MVMDAVMQLRKSMKMGLRKMKEFEGSTGNRFNKHYRSLFPCKQKGSS